MKKMSSAISKLQKNKKEKINNNLNSNVIYNKDFKEKLEFNHWNFKNLLN